MDIRGEFVFSVIDEVNKMENVSEKIDLEPTYIVSKDTPSVKKTETRYNIWSYELKFLGYEGFSDRLRQFIDVLRKRKMQIDEIKQIYKEVMIDAYIRCPIDQLGFSLDKQTLKTLSMLDLDMNFHILSFDNEEELT